MDYSFLRVTLKLRFINVTSGTGIRTTQSCALYALIRYLHYETGKLIVEFRIAYFSPTVV